MDGLKQRMLRGDTLAGTFLKTPSVEWLEVMAMSGLDFVCLDAEHAPFDRMRLDSCLAVARALNFPALVRVQTASASAILGALDSGATGIVCPHVTTGAMAADIARWSRFGEGGRGYAGSTRWAGFATNTMADNLARSQEETVVIAQIEEPEGVANIDAIAGTNGVDGLFVGPADLAVCMGETDMGAAPVRGAMKTVGLAAKKHNKTYMTFTANTSVAPDLQALGITMFFVASEHAFALSAARQVAKDLHGLPTPGGK